MDGLKKFLNIFCMTAILICAVGCGSDSSEESSTSGTADSSGQNAWWFNADKFIKRYNAALDRLGKENKQNYDLLKIVKVRRTSDEGGMCFFQLKLYNSGNDDVENFNLEASHKLDVFCVNRPDGAPINDNNVYVIIYEGTYPEDLHWIVFRATLLALPQFDDLNYGELSIELKKSEVVGIDHNGFNLYVNYYNGFMFKITDLSTQENIDSAMEQQRLAEAEENRIAAEDKRKNMPSKRLFNPNKPPKHTYPQRNPQPFSLGGAALLTDTRQDMVQALTLESPMEFEGPMEFKRWSKNRSRYMTNDGNYEYRDIIVTLFNERIFNLISCSDIFATEKGIREGSTLQQVFSAYGRRCVVQNFGEKTVYEYPYETQGGKLVTVRFVVKNDVVDYIVMGVVSDANEKTRLLSSVKDIAQSSSGTTAPPPAQTNSSAPANTSGAGIIYRSDWSIGDIGMGTSVDQMHQILGKEKEIRSSQNTPGNSYYEYNDVIVCVNNGKVISVATYTNKFQTEKGIRQGDNLSKVLSTYGRVCCVTNFDDLTLYEYPFEMGHGDYAVVRFAVKNDVVEYISLRRLSGNDVKEILSAQRSL